MHCCIPNSFMSFSERKKIRESFAPLFPSIYIYKWNINFWCAAAHLYSPRVYVKIKVIEDLPLSLHVCMYHDMAIN